MWLYLAPPLRKTQIHRVISLSHTLQHFALLKFPQRTLELSVSWCWDRDRLLDDSQIVLGIHCLETLLAALLVLSEREGQHPFCSSLLSLLFLFRQRCYSWKRRQASRAGNDRKDYPKNPASIIPPGPVNESNSNENGITHGFWRLANNMPAPF